MGGLCECGCGQAVQPLRRNRAERGIRKGEFPRFVPGHQLRASARPPCKDVVIVKDGYRMAYRPDHPRANPKGRVWEHVLVAEAAMGHFLDAKHPVHHVDENTANNANGNLVVCEDTAYHGLLHQRLRALRACGDPSALLCTFCGRYDDRRNLLVARKGGRANGESGHHQECRNRYGRERYHLMATS